MNHHPAEEAALSKQQVADVLRTSRSAAGLSGATVELCQRFLDVAQQLLREAMPAPRRPVRSTWLVGVSSLAGRHVPTGTTVLASPQFAGGLKW